MTKAELVGAIAADAKISKVAAGKALKAFIDGVISALRLLHNPSPSYFCILIVTFYVHSISLG